MNVALWLLALVAGALIPLQSAMNAEVGRRLGHPVFATAVNFMIGLVLLLAVSLAFARSFTGVAKLCTTPWWAWLGGVIGATFVFSAVVFVPRLGAVNFLVITLAGQLIASVLMDRFGLLNLEVRPVSVIRWAGLAVVVIGVLMVTNGDRWLARTAA